MFGAPPLRQRQPIGVRSSSLVAGDAGTSCDVITKWTVKMRVMAEIVRSKMGYSLGLESSCVAQWVEHIT